MCRQWYDPVVAYADAMKKSGWVALGMAVAVALTVVVLAAYGVGRGVRAAADTADDLAGVREEILGQGEFTEVGRVTVQSIRALSELSTVEMVEYTTIEKGDDRGWLNWATGDRIAMFAVARIEAGIDLALLEEDDIDADQETGKVRLKLPPAQITNVAVDNEATSVFDRDTGVFTKGDPDLERAARLAAEEILVVQAEEQGILQMAEDRAVLVLTDLLRGLGYTDIEVVVAS